MITFCECGHRKSDHYIRFEKAINGKGQVVFVDGCRKCKCNKYGRDWNYTKNKRVAKDTITKQRQEVKKNEF